MNIRMRNKRTQIGNLVVRATTNYNWRRLKPQKKKTKLIVCRKSSEVMHFQRKRHINKMVKRVKTTIVKRIL